MIKRTVYNVKGDCEFIFHQNFTFLLSFFFFIWVECVCTCSLILDCTLLFLLQWKFNLKRCAKNYFKKCQKLFWELLFSITFYVYFPRCVIELQWRFNIVNKLKIDITLDKICLHNTLGRTCWNLKRYHHPAPTQKQHHHFACDLLEGGGAKES